MFPICPFDTKFVGEVSCYVDQFHHFSDPVISAEPFLIKEEVWDFQCGGMHCLLCLSCALPMICGKCDVIGVSGAIEIGRGFFPGHKK